MITWLYLIFFVVLPLAPTILPRSLLPPGQGFYAQDKKKTGSEIPNRSFS